MGLGGGECIGNCEIEVWISQPDKSDAETFVKSKRL